jgi:hypothetical protein
MQEEWPMMFVGGVGSLAQEVWQVQVHKEFERLIDCSTWWPNFYTWSQNVVLQAIQEFVVSNKKDFINGWQIHEWGALGNSFNSTLTKWLMQQKDMDLGWVITKTG